MVQLALTRTNLTSGGLAVVSNSSWNTALDSADDGCCCWSCDVCLSLARHVCPSWPAGVLLEDMYRPCSDNFWGLWWSCNTGGGLTASKPFTRWRDLCKIYNVFQKYVQLLFLEKKLAETLTALHSMNNHCCQRPNYNLCIWQGSVLRWGGKICSHSFAAKCVRNVVHQKLLKSADVLLN